MQRNLNILFLLLFVIIFNSCNDAKLNKGFWESIEATGENTNKKLLDSLSSVFLNGKNDSINRSNLLKTAGYYYNLKSYDKYLLLTENAIKRSISSEDINHLAKGYYYLADYYDVNYVKDSAFFYYLKAKQIYRELKQYENEGRMSLYIGGIYYQNSDFAAAEEKGIEALKLLKNNLRLKYETYILIALSLKEQERLDESLYYFQNAKGLIPSMIENGYDAEKAKLSMASCYNDIGLVFEKKKDFKRAINQYNKALSIADLRIKKPKLYAMLLNNYSYALMQRSSISIKDDRLIKSMLFLGYKIRDSLNIKDGMISSKIRIGEYFLNRKDTVAALEYLNSGYHQAEEQNSSYDVLKSLSLLANADPQHATKYLNNYVKENYAFLNNERSVRNKFARIQYESEKLTTENNKLIKTNISLFILILLTVLILVILFYSYWLRSQNKRLILNSELDNANRKIENLLLGLHQKINQTRDEEQRRISRDLHDNIINKIFSIKFKISVPSIDLNEIRDIITTNLSHIQDEVRKISHDLSSGTRENIDMYSVLENIISNNSNIARINIDFHMDQMINWELYPSNFKFNIVYIIQEAIHNIVIHSKAKQASVVFLKDDNKILIQIIDNGVGFDKESVKNGIGLTNINDRVNIAKGTLLVNSQRGNGTTIIIEI